MDSMQSSGHQQRAEPTTPRRISLHRTCADWMSTKSSVEMVATMTSRLKLRASSAAANPAPACACPHE